jgi:hypothetical protein
MLLRHTSKKKGIPGEQERKGQERREKESSRGGEEFLQPALSLSPLRAR